MECFLTLEPGDGSLLLEDAVYLLEDGSGSYLLEDGSGFYATEDGTDNFLLLEVCQSVPFGGWDFDVPQVGEDNADAITVLLAIARNRSRRKLIVA